MVQGTDGRRADELLLISNASDAFAGIVGSALKARYPGMDLAGWLPGIREELFEAASGVAACVGYAHGEPMA